MTTQQVAYWRRKDGRDGDGDMDSRHFGSSFVDVFATTVNARQLIALNPGKNVHIGGTLEFRYFN